MIIVKYRPVVEFTVTVDCDNEDDAMLVMSELRNRNQKWEEEYDFSLDCGERAEVKFEVTDMGEFEVTDMGEPVLEEEPEGGQSWDENQSPGVAREACSDDLAAAMRRKVERGGSAIVGHPSTCGCYRCIVLRHPHLEEGGS